MRGLWRVGYRDCNEVDDAVEAVVRMVIGKGREEDFL